MHVSHGLHALPWRQPEPGAHVARAAAFMCLSQAEAGTGCPISMTYSVIPALRHQPEVADESGSRASPRSTTTGGWSRRPTRPARSAGWR